MEYESDILKRLIKTYGVVGNPCYISEIIKEFIVQGKERFPELFTYQADWLAHIDEFGLNPSYTVSYTGQSIYAPNTLERPVKSAILKGSTKYRDIDTGEVLDAFEDGRNLELVSVRMPVLMTYTNLFTGFVAFGYIDSGGNVVEIRDNILSDFIEINAKNIAFRSFTKAGEPYRRFGEFAFYDINKKFIGRKIYSDHTDECTTVPDGTKYVRIWTAPLEGLGLNTKGMMVYTKDKPSLAITKYLSSNKSNILTVNEDVTLRGIGNVKDTLDGNTGELTQRIGEIVLDGSEDLVFGRDTTHATNGRVLGFKIQIPNLYATKWDGTKADTIVCDKLKVTSQFNQFTGEVYNSISQCSPTEIQIMIKAINNSLNDTLNEIKRMLSENPVTVVYPVNDVIKTVDLTILDQNGQNINQLMSFNGGTHFNTGSLEGTPLPLVSVSVETDLEETLKVCSIEGNTM